MLDLECSLVALFGWSLRDLDETDIESLIPFMFHYPKWKSRKSTSAQKELFADEATWL